MMHTFLIIPVIDLRHGIVVHAIKGERDAYQPIRSLLTNHADPHAILAAFFELYPFKQIYIADIDAIQNKGNHAQLIETMTNNYPDCEFWVDAGLGCIDERQHGSNIKPVLGSENKFTEEHLSALIKNNPNIVLSLDFSRSGLMENPYLLKRPELWSKRLIVMMLHRVGSREGVDRKQLDLIHSLSVDMHNEIYSAGGVTNMQDLHELKRKGISGALLATTLHNGAITKQDLDQFLSKSNEPITCMDAGT